MQRLNRILNEEILNEEIPIKEVHDQPGQNKEGNWILLSNRMNLENRMV